jgi:hypothetical protein
LVFVEPSHRKVPPAAPALIAVLGSSLQPAFFGWAIGVAVGAPSPAYASL